MNARHVIVPGVADIVISSAYADVTCPGPPSCTGGDFITGGGWITTTSGAKANSGVAGGIKNGAFGGRLTYIDHGTDMKMKDTGVTAYVVTGRKTLAEEQALIEKLREDLQHLLDNIHIPVVVLDRDLRIRRFTPQVTRVLKVIATDVGRPIGHIKLCINVPDLEPWILDSIDTGSTKEREVQDQGGHWYSMRIRPYRVPDNTIDGAVIVWVDIDALRRSTAQIQQAEQALRRAHDELEIRVRERTADLAKANEALRAEISERKRAEAQIRASLKEKEVLLKEIHHRLKNNLQIICSLLSLQSEYVKDKQALEMYRESQARVKSMAFIHETLYQSKDLARIDFAQYLQNLVTYLFQSYGVNPDTILLDINVEQTCFDLDTAIPCGLIINELVSNAFKHAFPEGRRGKIDIELRSDDGRKFILLVRDNGVGFPKGLDFRNTESLGLQLVITLVDQLRGAIELHRNGGTEFKMTFTELKCKERGLNG